MVVGHRHAFAAIKLDTSLANMPLIGIREYASAVTALSIRRASLDISAPPFASTGATPLKERWTRPASSSARTTPSSVLPSQTMTLFARNASAQALSFLRTSSSPHARVAILRTLVTPSVLWT